MLDHLSKIKIEKPVDKIIRQLKNLISNGDIEPGQKLPSERALAQRLGVGRGHVREAIQKLEFFGILRTSPQSGTYVAGIGLVAIQGLISDVLDLEEHEFKSLVETRVILEKQTAALAAERRTSDDLVRLTNALNAYELKVKQGERAIEEDLLFHIEIAAASKNQVLKSLLMIITPDIVKNYLDLKLCSPGSFDQTATLDEHHAILNHIVDQQPQRAAAAMEAHLQDVVDFSRQAAE